MLSVTALCIVGMLLHYLGILMASASAAPVALSSFPHFLDMYAPYSSSISTRMAVGFGVTQFTNDYDGQYRQQLRRWW